MKAGLPPPDKMGDALPVCPACGGWAERIECELRTINCENGQTDIESVWTVKFRCDMVFESYADGDEEGWFVSSGCADVFNEGGDDLFEILERRKKP